MSKVKIVLNSAGMREVLKSESVRAAIKAEADRIAGACGDGYESASTIGRTRALASVRAETAKAKKDNYDNNTILKAVGR